MPTEFSVAKIDVGCGKKTKINHVCQKSGQANKNKTHLARSIGPTVKKKNVVKGLP